MTASQHTTKPTDTNPRVETGVSKQADIVTAHDGKQKARFMRPKTGLLPVDTGGGGKPKPRTVEDVVQSDDASSVWESGARRRISEGSAG
ncbi:MAG TPA: hypothetical protein VGL58_08620 [Caulobacteraceae bacterium]|jgi:hypothetical protein